MQCRFWQKGSCHFGSECRYAHSGLAGAGTDASICPFYLSGFCRFGEACRNSHQGSPVDKGGKAFYSPYGGGKKGKGRGKPSPVPIGGQGGGKGTFQNKTWIAGKGPSQSGVATSTLAEQKSLTGPYLGKGSELCKVWSMAEDQGHDDGICTAVAMTDRLCTGGCDNRLLLWRGEQSQEGLTLLQDNEVAFSASVSAMFFHAESKWLFCGLASGEIKAFCQQPLAEALLQGHTGPVTSMLVHEAVLLSGSEDGSIRAWRHDASAGGFACVATIQSPLGAVFSLLVQGGKGLWVGTQRGITCVELQSLQPAGNIESAARAIGLVPYMDCVIAAYADGVIRIFDSNGAEKFKHGPLGEHTTNTVISIQRHPQEDKDMLLCGQELGYVTVYDIPDFRPRGTFTTGYDGDVTAIVAMGDGVFITTGLSGDVVVWRWAGSSTMR